MAHDHFWDTKLFGSFDPAVAQLILLWMCMVSPYLGFEVFAQIRGGVTIYAHAATTIVGGVERYLSGTLL